MSTKTASNKNICLYYDCFWHYLYLSMVQMLHYISCSLFIYDMLSIIRTCHFCITFDFEDESYICYAFWVPYEVYIKDFSKFHHFTLVLSSWWFSIHLLELKIQMWRIPPCHTSKVTSWHVDYWYELHLWSSLSKIWLKVSKSGKNWQYCR